MSNTYPSEAASATQAFRDVSVSQPPLPGRKATPPPFSLRLTPEERARLEAEAGARPLGAYIRSRLFDGSAPPRRAPGRQPVRDHQLLAKVLGELGQSRIANNLNQLAKSANCGSLYLSPEDTASLQEACDAVQAMRRDLMQALGLERGDRP